MDDWVIPPYGKEVLLSNWVDRRYGSDEKGIGILPGMRAPDSCEKHRSLCQDSYTNEGYLNGTYKQYFMEQRVLRTRNYFAGTTSNVKLMDNADLVRNCTTTNTLIYDLLPKLHCQPKAKSLPSSNKIQEHQAELDLLQSFGNQTKTYNYPLLFKCQQKLENSIRMRTTYDSAYNSNRIKSTKC